MDDKEATKMVISQAVRQSPGQTGHSAKWETVDFQKHFNKKKTYWSEAWPFSLTMFETT